MKSEVVPPYLIDVDLPQSQIDRFVDRYGEAHLRLLYHAAFPLSLTPDLLYRLWANIQKNTGEQTPPIPWIAVSDVLFSGFCEEVGHELYELKPDLRRELLRRLSADPRFGEERLKELAEFMLVYTESLLHSPDPADRNFAQVQRWGAIAQLQPHSAARELAQALTHSYRSDSSDLNRLAEIVRRLSDPLANYPTLLDYAWGMSRYARGDEAGAATHFQKLLIGKQKPSVEGILLPLPENLPLGKSDSHETKLPIISRAWAYRVAIIFTVLGITSPLIYEWRRDRRLPLISSVSTSPSLTSSLSPSASSTPILSKTPTPVEQELVTLNWADWRANIWNQMFLDQLGLPGSIGSTAKFSFVVYRDGHIEDIQVKTGQDDLTFKEYVISRIHSLEGTQTLVFLESTRRDRVFYENVITLCSPGSPNCGQPDDPSNYDDKEKVQKIK